MGAGVAMLDYDNDGWLDLFFVNGARIEDPMPRAALPDKSDPSFGTASITTIATVASLTSPKPPGCRDTPTEWEWQRATTTTTATLICW